MRTSFILLIGAVRTVFGTYEDGEQMPYPARFALRRAAVKEQKNIPLLQPTRERESSEQASPPATLRHSHGSLVALRVQFLGSPCGQPAP